MGLFGLFKPAWDSKYPEKRKSAVAEAKTDKPAGIQKLLKIAEKASYEDARQEAWKRLALEAAGFDKSEIRLAAVKEISDEIILARVALHDAVLDVPMWIKKNIRIKNMSIPTLAGTISPRFLLFSTTDKKGRGPW